MEKFRRVGPLILLALLACALLVAAENRTDSTMQSSTIENRLRTVLREVAGVNRVEVLVNEAQNGGIIGVCVLTPSAGDAAAVFRIQRTVKTALGIDNDRIEVILMEENGK